MPIVVDQNPQPQPSTSESTLLDYFAVCGYDETLGLQLALPAGLRFCTERRKPRFPRLHNFANIREDGSRVSGAVLVYYEPVLDERLKSEMAALHVEHVRALTQSKSKEVPTISSTLPRPPRLKARDFAAGNLSAENQASDNADRRVSYYDASPQTALYVSKALCVITRIPVVSAAETLLRAIHNFLETREKPDLPLESLLYWLLQEVPLPLPGTVLRVRFSAAPFEIQLQRPNPALNELPFFDHSLRELFARVPIDKFVRVFACFLLEQQILVLSKDWRSLMLFSEALCALAFPFRWQLTYVPILPVTQLHFVEAPVPYLMGVCYGDDDLDAEDLGLGEAAAREKDAQEDGKLTRNRLSQLLSNQCVLDLETGRLEIPEDAPPLPGAKELTEKLKSVLETRLKTMECVDSTRPRARSDNQPQSARPETVLVDGRAVTLRPNRRGRGRDWAAKRQSISFDGVEESRVAADPTLEADKSAQSPGTEPSSYFADALTNTSLRRQFLHLFVRLFSRYGACIIAAKRDDDEWSRSSLIPFDKTAFLADQPESSVHFLSAFLETQMFASFVDTKLWLASGAAGETNRPASIDSTSSSLSTSDVALFDALCAAARRQQSALDELGEKQNGRPLDELLDEMEAVVARRIGAGNGNFSPATDYEVSRPRSLAGALAAGPFCGIWPHLNDALLEGIDSLASPAPSPWKQRRNVPVGLRAINNRHSLHTALLLNRSSTLLPAPASGNHAANATNTSIGGNPAVETADQDQHQHHFVEQLLREAKARTKRLVLLKMDRYEAEQLGHGGAIIAGIEENTLVAGLCDLLERVFAHGLERKQGRSALWSALVQHAEMEQQQAQERQQQQQQQQQQLPPPVSSGKLDPSSRSLSSTMLAPALAWFLLVRLRQPRLDDLEETENDVDGNDDDDEEKQADERRHRCATGASGRVPLAESNQPPTRSRWAMGSRRATASTAQELYADGPKAAAPRSTSITRSNRRGETIIMQPYCRQRHHSSVEQKQRNDDDDDAEGEEKDFLAKTSEIVDVGREKLAALVGELQRELNAAVVRNQNVAADVPHPQQGGQDQEPAWSRSLLRAANALCDKITGNPETNDRSARATSERPRSPGVLPPRPIVRKAPSMGTAGWQREEPDLARATAAAAAASSSARLGGTQSVEASPRRGFFAGNPTGATNTGGGGGGTAMTLNRRSSSTARRRATSPVRAIVLPLLSQHITHDLRVVLRMSELKAEVGFARAFVRLALERQLLHRHLATLFANTALMHRLYRPYAFARCDEEREQLLLHVMSLNAARLRCFTNTFTKTKIAYQFCVSVGGVGTASKMPVVWIQLRGSLYESPCMRTSTPLFRAELRNLGELATLRIGHSEEPPSKWWLDCVVVRNDVTGQTYRFRCERWLGGGGGGLEKLLVAEPYQRDPEESGALADAAARLARLAAENMEPHDPHAAHQQSHRRMMMAHAGEDEDGRAVVVAKRTTSRARSSSRARSPSAERSRFSDQKRNGFGGSEAPSVSSYGVTELEAELGEVVNALVRASAAAAAATTTTGGSGAADSAEIARLLAGDRGLVAALERLFAHGRIEHWSARIFRGATGTGNTFPWDYVERAAQWLAQRLERHEDMARMTGDQIALIRHILRTVDAVQKRGAALGRESRFHAFVLLALRHQVLPGVLQLLAWTPATAELFGPSALLRQPPLLAHLCRLLETVALHLDPPLKVHPALTYGIEL